MARKSVISKFISGSAIYLLSNILSAAVPFLLMPVLTRYLRPDEYGQIAMFQMAQAIFATLIGMNVVGAAIRKYYDPNILREELKYFIFSCFIIIITTTSVLIVALIVFHDFFVSLSGINIWWLLAAAVCAALGLIPQMLMGQWQVQNQTRQYASMQICTSVCLVIFSIVFVVMLSKGAEGRVFAQIISSVSFAVLALVIIRKSGWLGAAWRPTYTMEALNFGAPLIPHSIGLLLFSFVDRIVIADNLGLSHVGSYIVAVQLTSILGLVTSAINNAYVPWLYERLQTDDPRQKKRIVKITYVYFTIAILVASTAFLAGPIAIRVIAGSQYTEAGAAVGWLALTQALNGMYLMVTNYIFYSKKTGLLSFVTLATGVLNGALLLILISPFGLVGAAVAGTVAMLARFLLTWWVANLSHPMPWFNLKAE